MFIEKLYYQNVGPIGELDLTFRKNKNGTPVPLIIVGKNGSGKSILLSNIVDAFYELAGRAYVNATETGGNGHLYYKEISPQQIRVGQNHMLAHIYFRQDNKNIEYLFKSGKFDFNEYKDARKTIIDDKLNWHQKENFKNVIANEEWARDAFEKDIVCYFGPNRYMKPAWMGNKYFVTQNVETYSLRQSYNRELNNPVTAVNIPELTLQWLFDVITDSRADLEKQDDGYKLVYPSSNDINLLSISRLNVEKIMSEILGEKVVFRMGNRSLGQRRFSIVRISDQRTLIPSLDAMSTGQLALFNLFATIIRYADTDDINFSHRFEDIKGIVVIDEVELHLHTQLQRNVLPKLFALFPNIQFVITSHSPLFLLGMKEQFGDDGFDIIEMPSGEKISAEQFTEFESAYQSFQKTERYQEEIKAAINEKNDCPLIITEGATDWKHLKAAHKKLLHDPRCSEWLSSLNFVFLEYEPKNSPLENCYKLEMSGSHLQTMCEQYCLMQQPRKMIFIADSDDANVRKALAGIDSDYKSWGNSVYSIVLPLPPHRADRKTLDICIEHYYTDDQLKLEVEIDGVKRRLFMGCEFDSDGISLDRTMFCNERNSCGKEKIRIIDGHENSPRVYRIDDTNKTNIALSKMKFATTVLESHPPFNQMDFSNFIPLFEIIRDILQEKAQEGNP